MTDYTPTTDEVFEATLYTWLDWHVKFPNREAARAGFNRWMVETLAAHDAEKRAEWEAEQSEPEWEYGIRPEDDEVPLGISPMPTLEAAQTRANNIRGGWVIERRRKAGPWLPVPNTTKEAIRPALVDNRDPECVKAWPGCHDFGYDPACCRFPKSCSAGGFKPVPDTANTESEKP